MLAYSAAIVSLLLSRLSVVLLYFLVCHKLFIGISSHRLRLLQNFLSVAKGRKITSELIEEEQR